MGLRQGACPDPRGLSDFPGQLDNSPASWPEVDSQIPAQERDGVIDDRIDAGYLMFMMIAIAAWWSSVPQVAEMITGVSAQLPGEQERRRAAVVEAAQRLAAASRDRPVDARTRGPSI